MQQVAHGRITGLETFAQTLEAVANVEIVPPHRHDHTDMVVTRCSEMKQCCGVRSGLGRSPKLLELVNDNKDLAWPCRVFRCARQDSIPYFVRLTRAYEIGQLAGGLRPRAGLLRCGADAIG